MCKGGNKTQTTSQSSTTNYPQWTQDAGQNAYNVANSLTGPFLQTPAYGVAGFNSDQLKGFDLVRQMTQGAFTGTPTAVPTGATMTAANSNAAQLGAGDISAFLNPYTSAVVDQAANKARGELAKTEAGIGARYAAAGAFGGGREALARGKAKEAFDENLQATTAQLLAQGYDNATATAMANTQLRQQTAENNAQREQDARSANLGYGLQAAQLAEAMRNGNVDRQNTALQQLLGTGAVQQQLGQNALDLPLRNLQILLGATPGVFNTSGVQTGTSPDNRPGALQQLLGGALTIGGMGVSGGGSLLGNFLGGLSDKETKTNIEKLGKDPETGLDMYAYDYKDDVAKAKKSGKPMPPKRVSAMAQDIEKAEPGSTKRVGGKLVVKGR